MLTRFRNLSYFMAYTVATIPLWHYISEVHILLLMTAVLIFAYLNVVLSSIDAAKTILSSEKAKTPLPRWLPKKPKYEKWWLLVRHTLKWHLLLVPVKMCLALGFMQWLRSGAGDFTNSILRPYFYNSSTDPSYPVLWLMCLGLGIIILFTILEAMLSAALATLTQKPSSQIGLRILIALSIIGISSQVDAYFHKAISNDEACFFYACNPCNCTGTTCCGDPIARTRRLYTDTSETIMTALFTTSDMGVLLTANIMRPLSYVAGYDGSINPLFVLRQCLAGILGIFIYLGTTWAILWFVEDEPHPAILSGL